MCKHIRKMKCNAWKEKKSKKRKEKKSIAKEGKEKDEWGTKCLNKLCGIKWATQWKLRVEKCTN